MRYAMFPTHRFCGFGRLFLYLILWHYSNRLLPPHAVSITSIGKTFVFHKSHLGKACRILNISISRNGPLPNGVILGLAHAHGKSNGSDNIASASSLKKVIDFERTESQFSLPCFFPYCFYSGPRRSGCAWSGPLSMTTWWHVDLVAPNRFCVLSTRIPPRLGFSS